MADTKQSKSLRPKGPLLPIQPPNTPTSFTSRNQDSSALNLITNKEDEKPILFNAQDTPQPFLEPSILEKRRGEHVGWKAQEIGGSSK